MKILEINKFNCVRGGADKHFVDLVRLLEKNGNEVAIFAMDHPQNLPSTWSKYFVSRVDYENGNILNKSKGVLRIFWSFEAKRKIGKLLDEFKPDIVHVHNIYHQISPSILPEIKKRGIPIVMTVHDWKLICPNYLLNCGAAEKKIRNDRCGEHPPKQKAIVSRISSIEDQYSSAKADEIQYCDKCIAGKYWHCLKNKCVKKSYLKSLIAVCEMYFHRALKVYEKNIDLYVAPSRFVKDTLTKAGFPENKIKVLPHFIQAPAEVSPRQASQEKFALYFGRVSKEKGADELIEIFKNLPVKLVLAGNKDGDLVIPEWPNMEYIGFKTPDEIEALIQNSEFVVSASRLPETFGLIALEAAANGRPFVGYDTGAYGEIVQNGQNGYLAQNMEELTALIGKLLINKGKNLSFDIGNFDPQRYYAKFIDIFQGLC